MTALDDLAHACLPCPFCGETLIVHNDHHGEWIAHRQEPGPCVMSIHQIFSASDVAEWNLRAATAGPAIGNLHRLDEPETDQSNPSLGEAWRPIETAPRDGTVIDLWATGYGRKANMCWMWCEGFGGEAWTDEKYGRGYPYSENQFTHWLPLPAPPPVPSPGGEGNQGVKGASRTNSADAPAFGAAEDAQRKSEGGAS